MRLKNNFLGKEKKAVKLISAKDYAAVSVGVDNIDKL